MLNKKILMLCIALFSTPLTWASLISIPAGVTATGSASFSESDSFLDGLTHSGEIGIGSSLVEINNGLLAGAASVADVTLLSPISFDIDVTNGLFDTFGGNVAYEFTATLTNNLVDSARFFLEFLFSHSVSAEIFDVDPLFGDLVNGSSSIQLSDNRGTTNFSSQVDAFPDDLGPVVSSDAGTELLELILSPNETVVLTGLIDITGLELGFGALAINASGSLDLTDIQVIPTAVSEPSAALLFFLVSAGLVMRRKSKV